MDWMDPKQSEARWDQRQREEDAVPIMDRAEYLRKYPRGGPERFSGTYMSPDHREFIAAIKRRNKESKRPGWIKFWWAMAGLACVFSVLLVVAGFPQATFVVLALLMAYCWIEMGMNLT